MDRLQRIDGQVPGLQHMLYGVTYCMDVLAQVQPKTKAKEARAAIERLVKS